MNKKNIFTTYVLPVIAMVFFGYLLLMATFILDWAFQSAIRYLFIFFINADLFRDTNWFPPVNHTLFMILIGVISWLVLRSKKFKDIYKAIYTAVPTAVILVTLGIIFWRTPIWTYVLGFLMVGTVLYYFWKNKLSWMYWFAVLWVTLTLFIGTLFGMEI